jgi:hypothetical protein
MAIDPSTDLGGLDPDERPDTALDPDLPADDDTADDEDGE